MLGGSLHEKVLFHHCYPDNDGDAGKVGDPGNPDNDGDAISGERFSEGVTVSKFLIQEGGSRCSENWEEREKGCWAICSRGADLCSIGAGVEDASWRDAALSGVASNSVCGREGCMGTELPQLVQNRASSLGNIIPQCGHWIATRHLLRLAQREHIIIIDIIL